MHYTGPSEQLLREDCIAEKVCSNKDESREQEQNALVLYRGDGAVVPYEKKLKPRDKVLKPRAKVHLDDETTREWSVSDGERRKRW